MRKEGVIFFSTTIFLPSPPPKKKLPKKFVFQKIKNILSALFLSIVALSATAGVPDGVRFQTTLRGSDGQLIANQNVSIRITIMDKGPRSSRNVFSETHIGVLTSNDGVASILVGKGNPDNSLDYIYLSEIDWTGFANNAWMKNDGVASILVGKGNPDNSLDYIYLSEIDWTGFANNAWIKVEIDPTGGSNYSLIAGESQLMSTPFALAAKEASSAKKIGNFTLTNAKVEFSGSPSLLNKMTTTLAGVNVTPNSENKVQVLTYTPTYLKITLDNPSAGAYYFDISINGGVAQRWTYNAKSYITVGPFLPNQLNTIEIQEILM